MVTRPNSTQKLARPGFGSGRPSRLFPAQAVTAVTPPAIARPQKCRQAARRLSDFRDEGLWPPQLSAFAVRADNRLPQLQISSARPGPHVRSPLAGSARSYAWL